jgi:hypothetical protein
MNWDKHEERLELKINNYVANVEEGEEKEITIWKLTSEIDEEFWSALNLYRLKKKDLESEPVLEYRYDFWSYFFSH